MGRKMADSRTRISQMFLVVKNLSANAGDARDMGSTPGLGRFPRVGKGNPLQYSHLEHSVGRGTWQAIQSLAKSQTRLIVIFLFQN